ncbi:MAG: EamA family transporter, partial [Actinobacteria bacterium]|nr:EamA family transporter [Actinomycetota bacterium]
MNRSQLGRDTQNHFGPAEWGMTAGVALTWGASFLFIAIAIDHVATGVVPVARLGFGALALSCFPAARRMVAREDIWRVALLGLVAMTIPFYLYPLAEQTVSSSVTGMINGSIPVTTVLAAAVLTRTMPSRRRIVAVLIGFGGIALISFGSVGDGKGASVRGVLFLLAATCCYAFTSIMSREMQVKYGTLTVLLDPAEDGRYPEVEVRDVTAGRELLDLDPLDNGAVSGTAPVFAGRTYILRVKASSHAMVRHTVRLAIAVSSSTPDTPSTPVVPPIGSPTIGTTVTLDANGRAQISGTSVFENDRQFYSFTAP